MVVRLVLLIALSLAGFVTAANAQSYQAVTTATLNMRYGPGTQYAPPVGQIPPNTRVTVEGCYQGYGWCRVVYNGVRGWVSSQYLRDPQRNAPLSSVGAQLGLAILQFLLNQAQPPAPPPPPLPGPFPPPFPPPTGINQVCFYTDSNFTGQSFCAGPGGRESSLRAQWNNRISSIRVGRATGGVTVCRNDNLNGVCQTYTSNAAQLPGIMNNAISSYRVGDGALPPPPPPVPPPVPNNQVCFYQDWNYGGASFCANGGTQQTSLPAGWNDTISSIRVGSASGGVYVCSEFGLSGRCDYYGTSYTRLEGVLNNSISSFRVGGPPTPPRPPFPNPGPFPPPPPFPNPGPSAEVCFYQDWNYGGAAFCRGAGDQNASLPAGWNDAISSIRVDRGVFVQVCSDANYRGRCVPLNNSASQLTGGANDSISSYRIFVQ